MAWASFQAVCGLLLGLLVGAWLALGPAIGSAAQALIGFYELVAPVLIFAILGPSLLKLLRHDRGDLRRFTVFTVAWFSVLRLLVCLVAAGAVVAVYRLPWAGGKTPGMAVPWLSLLTLAENRYLLTFAAACLAAWLLRHRDGPVVQLFLNLPDYVEAAGNLLTRLTALFGFLVGVYIISLPDMLLTAINGMRGATLHPLLFRWFGIETATAGGLMAVYLAVTALTAVLCFLLHAGLLTWARCSLPGFSVRGYLSGYLVRVYPLIWSTGAESLAIPANLATIRRYGQGLPDALRDLTAGLAATLNLNGTLICCLVLIPAVCMTIGHTLSITDLLACLPLIFLLGYAIPGIPGELVIFAGPIAQALGITGAERELFLLLFLSWQIGLTDSFRSAGSATDGVPATLLLTQGYRYRFGIPAAIREVASDGGPLTGQIALVNNTNEGGPYGG